MLPSDAPSGRTEAAAAAAALQQLLADPAAAAHQAVAWRQAMLAQSSAAALLGLTADYTPQQHQAQLRQGASEGAGGAGGRSPLVAGPSWLARSSGSCAGGGSAALLEAARSSSSFLRPEHSGAPQRSSSPLPPLALPRMAGRQGDAMLGSSSSPLTAGLCCGRSSCSSVGIGGAPAVIADTQQLLVTAPSAVGDPAWDAYCQGSLAAALAVCMGEAVRQVEVGCAERGRLLAQLWNSYTLLLGATVRQQAAQLAQLAATNANLSAGGWTGSPLLLLEPARAGRQAG